MDDYYMPPEVVAPAPQRYVLKIIAAARTSSSFSVDTKTIVGRRLSSERKSEVSDTRLEVGLLTARAFVT